MHCQNTLRLKQVALVVMVPALVLAFIGCAPPPVDPPGPQPLPVTYEPEGSGTFRGSAGVLYKAIEMLEEWGESQK